jgi:hypothetical protein
MTAPFPGDDTFEKRPCLAGRSTYAKESARYPLLSSLFDKKGFRFA